MANKAIGGTKTWGYLMQGRENMAIDNEEKFAGMTRAEVLEAAHALNREFDENDEDSSTYSEYIKVMEEGKEMLKKQEGYYRYLSEETNN
jgi:flagellar motility protein MotE (MotC chaperone)